MVCSMQSLNDGEFVSSSRYSHWQRHCSFFSFHRRFCFYRYCCHFTALSCWEFYQHLRSVSLISVTHSMNCYLKLISSRGGKKRVELFLLVAEPLCGPFQTSLLINMIARFSDQFVSKRKRSIKLQV